MDPSAAVHRLLLEQSLTSLSSLPTFSFITADDSQLTEAVDLESFSFFCAFSLSAHRVRRNTVQIIFTEAD